MIKIHHLIIVATIVLAAGCATQSDKPQNSSDPNSYQPSNVLNKSAEISNGFINRVWEVSESKEVSSGTLYVFLSDGTMVTTSSYNKPALSNWTLNEGVLTIIEDSQPYRVEILKLTDGEFAVKINNPQSPVEIKFKPAAQTAESNIGMKLQTNSNKR